MNVIQRYVKPIGGKAFINRSVWKKNGKNYAWVITNKMNFNPQDEKEKKQLEYNRFCTNFKIPESCSMVQIKKGKILDETILFLENIVRYFQEHKKIKFDELIGDFIKDEDGVLWLIDIKGFIINDPIYLNPDVYVNYMQDFKKSADHSVILYF